MICSLDDCSARMLFILVEEMINRESRELSPVSLSSEGQYPFEYMCVFVCGWL